MIVIYSLISILISFLIISSGFSQDKNQDIYTYCFEKNVNLNSAANSIKPFLLDDDIITKRIEDGCLDVAISSSREKLVAKMLNKRFHVLGEDISNSISDTEKICRLELKITTKKKSSGTNLKLGQSNTILKNESSQEESTTQDLLLGDNKAGSLEYDTKSLNVICRKIGQDRADLTFSFKDLGKNSLSTSVVVRLNEGVDLGSIVKDLNNKNKTFGIPQSEIKEEEGQITTKYELKLK